MPKLLRDSLLYVHCIYDQAVDIQPLLWQDASVLLLAAFYVCPKGRNKVPYEFQKCENVALGYEY
jgi:hypothetical protein